MKQPICFSFNPYILNISANFRNFQYKNYLCIKMQRKVFSSQSENEDNYQWNQRSLEIDNCAVDETIEIYITVCIFIKLQLNEYYIQKYKYILGILFKKLCLARLVIQSRQYKTSVESFSTLTNFVAKKLFKKYLKMWK